MATCGNISTGGAAGVKTRDIAAAKAGLGSGKTLEAAQRALIFGERRPRAAKLLGWSEIEAIIVDRDALLAEHDENELRKQFTITERIAIAERIEARLAGRQGRPAKGGNISTISDDGKTRDLAAAKAGLGSGKTLEAAQAALGVGADRKLTI